jgi:hypothetical protein
MSGIVFCNDGLAVRRRGALAGMLAALVLAGCGGGRDDDVATAPQASATIGAAGGTLVGPDDVRVVVPAGALASDTVITVTRTAAGAPALPASAAGTGPVYAFTPHGLHFDQPVTISLPSTLDPAVNPVLMAQPGQAWERVDAVADAGRVSWSTTHFSWSFNYPCMASYPPGTPLPPNGPPGCQFPSSSVAVSASPASAMTTVTSSAYRLGAAADVTVRFRYSAPLDCVNASIKTWRFKRPATAPAQVTTTPVVLTQTAVPGIPGASRLTGSTDLTHRFDHADNGIHETGYFFACQGGITVGGAVQFNVQAPPPPAMPATPTITQQPANASVLVGATANFEVLATAPDNLVLRWERKAPGATAFAAAPGAAPIAGGSRLGVAAVLADTGAVYRAQVCNSLGGVDNCLYSDPATLTVTLPPPPPGTLAAPSSLSGGFLSNCAISAAGGVLCWGANGSGELGRGSTQPAEGTPAPATGLTAVSSVGSSNYTSCAVHGGGRLSCWGGYAGVAQFEHSAVPVQMAGVTDARRVRVANSFYCTIDGDRRIRCNDVTGPLQIDGQVVEDAVDMAFVSGGRCVLSASGEARCAQFDGSAVLVTARVVPAVRSLGGVPGFSGLGTPFCVVLQSGAVRCWGNNANGQLGTGTTDPSVADVSIAGIGPAVQVAVGTRHACALAADATVSCWGSGYLGNGAGVELARAPRAVNGLSGIVEITAGYDTTCALRGDGTVLCWGDNTTGSVGSGTLGNPALVPTPTAAGAVFAH